MIFNKEQFDRLFPFYILVSKGLSIDAYGPALEKMHKGCINKSFSGCFEIDQPQHTAIDFAALKLLADQQIEITINNQYQKVLKGQLEFLEATNQVLFIGSPDFRAVDEVENSGLSKPDFGYNSQLVDLLQALKEQEIINTDLKQVLDTANRHKSELKKTAANVHDIALLSMQNPDPLFRISLDGEILMCNQAADELIIFNFKEGRYTRTDFWKFISQEKAAGDSKWTFEAVSNKKIYLFICRSVRNRNYYNVYGRDITQQKNQEIELIDARIQAEHLARTKETFLANMSHEIRTPMNAIMGMSNQLAKTNLTAQQQFYLETIHAASDNLLNIINDILDLSKIEAGKLGFENIGFELRNVAKRVVQVLGLKAEEKGFLLRNSSFDENISPVLIGDPYRLNQVLLNLISNAIKFTEKGSVDLSFKLLEDNDTLQVIKISVKDTGIGMDEAFMKLLFDKFSQEYESVSRKHGGTGLGMSICKELIDLMGGSIDAESKKGEGTTISFTVEFKKGGATDLPEKDIVDISTDFLAGKKVLVTDDNETNRMVAAIILKNFGAEVVEAADGKQAIEAINKYALDIILMDIQMPVMNGFESASAIRLAGNTTPIIALTAEAIKGEREKCIAAGMDDYISKPFKEEEFLNVIAKWLKKDIPVAKFVAGEASKNETPLYDLSEIKAISRGNDGFVLKMVNTFCLQTPKMLQEMTEAYHANNFVRVKEIAHKIKPSIDNLEIGPLKLLLKNIENITQAKMITGDLTKIFEQADVGLTRVIIAMREEYPH